MKRLWLLILILFYHLDLFSQGSGVSDVDRANIEQSLLSIVGDSCGINDVVCVDSILKPLDTNKGGFENPYNTLTHCFIFTCSRINQILNINSKSKQSLGIFKNGQVLALLDTAIGTFSTSSGRIKTIADLNNDGEVDIVITRTLGVSSPLWEGYWIISWNGSVLRLINTIDDETKESSIKSPWNYLKFVDIDGNGIIELVTENENENGIINKAIYSWNGQQYGNWGFNPSPLQSGAYSRSNLIVNISCSVLKNADSINYRYSLTNSPLSRQSINEYFLESPDTLLIVGTSPIDWVMAGQRGRYFGWIALPGFNKFLLKGRTENLFAFKDNNLPAIVNSYIRGYSLSDNFFADSQPDWDKIYQDVLSNSMVVRTIAPHFQLKTILPMQMLDSLTSYTTQSRSLEWIKEQTTADKYLGYFNSAKTSLQQNNIVSTRSTLNQVLQDVNIDSMNNITSEAYALIRFNTEYLLAQLPTAPVAGWNVKLVNSAGTKLTGGTLQYYDGSWKDAVNNSDGTFFVNTTKTSLSLRMTYEYGTQTKSNVAVGSDTITFQTVNAQIQLQNSNGVSIDTGSVQYYAGAWRSFGTTINGIAGKELLPNTYSFRMTYAYASKDKQQDISTNSIVVFQTVNAAVQLQNSQGALIDQGTVQYYSGAWRAFGTTNNGTTNKELLPNNYSFRMTYAYASKDKQQDLNTNPTVVFQTVNAAVQLQNSQGTLIDQGTVQYYSGAWRTFGNTNNGTTNKELLPNNYSFRMTYEYASKDKQQDLSTNPTVIFQTVNAVVQLQNSQGTLIDQGTVQYYSGAWRTLGTTANGVATKDLLPNTYSFRMTYEYASIDKQQDITTNNIVGFATVLCTIRAKNSQNELIDGATISYYSGAWRLIGLTVNGEITKELLPLNLPFRVKYGTKQQDKQQNILTNNVVEIVIP